MDDEIQNKPVQVKSNTLRYAILAIIVSILIPVNYILDGVFTIFVICGGEGTGCGHNTFADITFVIVTILEAGLLWFLLIPKNKQFK